MSILTKGKMKGTYWHEYSAKRQSHYKGSRHEFSQLPKGDQTQVYFDHHGCSMGSQGKFHENPAAAISNFAATLKG